MSVTKKVLEDSTFSLLDNGQLALHDYTKSGALRIHRIISRKEAATLCYLLLLQFKHDNPGKQVLQLLTDEGILAITMLPKPESADEDKEGKEE